MRTLAFVVMLAVLANGCGPPEAGPAFGPPQRGEMLQPLFANSDVLEGVRIEEKAWLKQYGLSAVGGLAAVRKQLDRVGPSLEAGGQRFDGLTTWALRWSFNFDPKQSGCVVRGATIELETVITLPHLEDAESLTPAELGLWQAYLDELRTHEDGHVRLYIAATRELREHVLQAGVMPDCESLSASLAQMGERMLETMRQRDLLFDAATGHGAVFPLGGR